jgi:hypothetical protein
MTRVIACPVALHPDGTPTRLPVLTRATGGQQLVRIEAADGESPVTAAARALLRQSGLETRAALHMGRSDDIVPGECWHFALCRVVPPVRDRWQHPGAGDGSRLAFQWMTLEQAAATLQGRCARALEWIGRCL